MGQDTSSGIKYGIFVGNKKDGETRVLRNREIGMGPLHTGNKFGMKTNWEAIEKCCDLYPNSPCYGTRKKLENGELDNKYTWKTHEEIRDLSKKFAKGLKEFNLVPEIQNERNEKLKFLGIYCRNREEWMISDFACGANSCTVVTIYDTLGDKAIQYILEQTQLTTILVESRNLKRIVNLAKQNLIGELKNLVVLDNEDETSKNMLKNELGIHIYSFKEIIEKGEQSNVELEPANSDTFITICYTSGTTGIPKGAMIKQSAIFSDTDVLDAIYFEVNSSDTYISFLPLAHIMERLIIYVTLTHGVRVGFYSGDIRNIQKDATLLKPTCLCGVPRIFQRIYEIIQSRLNKLTGFKKKLVEYAIADKIEQFKKTGEVHHFFWDNTIFKQIRDILGGKVRFMLTGSAPMAPEILIFFKIAFSLNMTEGYGQTEAVPGFLLTKFNDYKAGHIGGPGYSGEIKLVDVKELGYTSEDVNPETGLNEPRGEICIRGPILFTRYFKNKEATDEVLDEDGWFHSGDIGVILTNYNNAVKIIDRKKNIFKLSQGEYIAPEKLENVLEKSLYVEQICVYGDSFKNYLISFIVPRPETCVEFLKGKGIETDKKNVVNYYDNIELKKEILNDLEKLGRKNDFKGFEIIKKIYLCKEPFTIDNDLATPTLKVKRHNLKKRYENEIKEMYQ